MRALLIVLAFPLLGVAACSSTPGTTATGTGVGGSTTTGSGGADQTSTGGSSSASGATGTGGAGASCGNAAWVTYGHDGQRTSASDGCIDGPLTPLWTYVPAAPAGKTLKRVFHPLATKDSVFLHWSASDPPYTGTSAADRVTIDGARAWTFDSGTDTDLGDWGSIWKDKLALNSDGIYLLGQADGKAVGSTGVDWWGQTIPTDGALLFSNTSKSDGPGLFVGALDEKAALIWKQNEQGTMCGQGFADQTGGIALDGTTLFYAPLYASGSGAPPGFPSGVYAFDSSAMGKPLWNITTTPGSAISAASGLVFLIEGTQGMSTLVARKQGDGSVAWSVDLPNGGGAQAPVLAGGLVIVATATGIVAVGQADGKPAWKNAVSAPASPSNTPISNGCGGLQPLRNLPTTSLAVALGSGTLVAVQGTDVTVMALETGATKWTGKQNVMGSLVNPVIVGNRLYVVNQNGQPSDSLLALQAAPAM
jgi:hypothetical protein